MTDGGRAGDANRLCACTRVGTLTQAKVKATISRSKATTRRINLCERGDVQYSCGIGSPNLVRKVVFVVAGQRRTTKLTSCGAGYRDALDCASDDVTRSIPIQRVIMQRGRRTPPCSNSVHDCDHDECRQESAIRERGLTWVVPFGWRCCLYPNIAQRAASHADSLARYVHTRAIASSKINIRSA